MKTKNVRIMERAYNCKTNKESLEFYNEHADQVEEVLLDSGYDAPYKFSLLFNRFIENKNNSILDVGCGTGLLAKYLRIYKFYNIDGLDAIYKMIQICKKTDLYKNLYLNNFYELETKNFKKYDVVCGCGLFTVSHINPKYFNKFIELTKVDGHIIVSCTEPLYKQLDTEIEKYINGIELVMCQEESYMTPYFEKGYPYKLFVFKKKESD